MIEWTEDRQAELREYLGSTTANRYPIVGGVDPLQRIFEVEASDQAVRCVVSDFVPLPLVEALYRRVARNIALRQFPTGTNTLASDGGVAVIRYGLDTEIKRLEGPYRRYVVA